MPNQPYRLARYLGHEAIKQAAKPASSHLVQTDDAFDKLLKRLADAEPTKRPCSNDNLISTVSNVL